MVRRSPRQVRAAAADRLLLLHPHLPGDTGPVFRDHGAGKFIAAQLQVVAKLQVAGGAVERQFAAVEFCVEDIPLQWSLLLTGGARYGRTFLLEIEEVGFVDGTTSGGAFPSAEPFAGEISGRCYERACE